MFPGVLGASILKRAQQAGRLTVAVHDLRDYTHDSRRTVDDRPYGGGPGMIMRVEPIVEAAEAIKRGCAAHASSSGAASRAKPRDATHGGVCRTILMSPQGQPLTSTLAKQLAGLRHLVVICGHYEGVDERVKLALVDQSISIGDYVLTGGELPALVLIDAVARFISGVIGHAQAAEDDSFAAGWLEHPQYTRPPLFRGLAVPEVLLSGDHRRIAWWRKLQSVARTLTARPDLVRTDDDRRRHASGPRVSVRPVPERYRAHGAPSSARTPGLRQSGATQKG